MARGRYTEIGKEDAKINLLVLEKKAPGHYLGTERQSPFPCGALTEENPVYPLIMNYIKATQEDGFFHDDQGAKNLVKLCNGADLAGFEFEIVEVTKNDSVPLYKGEFLGFDIAINSRDSLIKGNVQRLDRLIKKLSETRPKEFEFIQEKLIEIKGLFSSELNSNLLFRDFRSAKVCFEKMALLREKGFSWNEEKWQNYEILGLYRVNGDR